MERIRPWLVWWATVAVTGAFSALYLTGWRAMIALVMGGVAAFFLFLLFRDLFRRRPRIEFAPPNFRDVRIGSKSARIASITVLNRPKVGMEAIRDLTVTLKYTAEATGKMLHENVNGRWEHHARVSDPPEATVARASDLPGYGSGLRAEVGYAYLGDSALYLADEWAHLDASPDRPVGANPVLLEARLQGLTPGRHIDKTVRFRLTGTAEGIDIQAL